MHLRPTTITDLDTLYTFQLDEEASQMAAFMPENWTDKDAYIAKWTKLITEGEVHAYTIIVDEKIVGSIGSYPMEGEWQITYWVGREFWGRGIATEAARAFLQLFTTRPIYGRAAFDNAGSIKVLEKCGFVKTGTDRYQSHARGKEIEELIYKLA
jgi:[ribosomal protein S5]-alanine N-acetyltransferase